MTKPQVYPLEYYVYALGDPQTGFVRYIGMTRQPWGRLKSHMWAAVTGRDETQKAQWIRELFDLDLRPSFVLLEGLKNRGVAMDAERRWIQYFLPSGLLLNSTALKQVPDRYTEPSRQEQPYPVRLRQMVGGGEDQAD